MRRDMRPHLCVALFLMLTSQYVAFYIAPTLDPSLVSSTRSAVAHEVTKVPVLGGRRVDHRRRLNASERGCAYRRQQMPRKRSPHLFSGVGSIAAPPPPTQVRGREGEIACKGGGLLSCNILAHKKRSITPACTSICSQVHSYEHSMQTQVAPLCPAVWWCRVSGVWISKGVQQLCWCVYLLGVLGGKMCIMAMMDKITAVDTRGAFICEKV